MNRKKTCYYDLSRKELEEVRCLPEKPSILLHTCCAVCAGVPLEQLTPHFRVTLYYGNSNIFPEEEYDRRLAEVRRILRSLYPDVSLVVPPYDHASYMADLRPYREEREGGRRCRLCYRKRMEEAYRYAWENHFDWFTTVMTISRQKDSFVLNQIGEELSSRYAPVRYFYSDFKKRGGQQRSLALRDERGLYQQTYCGCEYSLRRPGTFTGMKEDISGEFHIMKGSSRDRTQTSGKEEQAMKYRCTVCGHIYDEEKEGVKFADLPDDWVCPTCKAPKSKFVPVEENQTWASEHVLGVAKDVPEDIKKDLEANFTGECSEVGMYLAMSRVAYREGYAEIGMYYEKAAMEEANHASRFAELLGEVLTDSTEKNLQMRVDAEYGATAGKTDLAKRAKAAGLDAVHDTVHEMARDEARHGKAFAGLLKRYFGK